jgi:predicted unusual protein kinase regulating ubiquinone biosynthesis (AarF/ABC1/UbiB family)
MRPLARVIGVALVAAGALAVARSRRRGGGPVSGTSVATRNAQLAVIGARSGAAYALHRTRLVTASGERRDQLEAEYQLRTAAQVADALGNMKGALMKIGQMASYLDEGLPEPVRDALASLQQDAPAMTPELCAQVVRAELGDEPAQVFAQWDPEPIAAA